jgi:hypothetical protein
VEYYKYAVESLYDKILYGGIGDCDDHAILTAALGKAFGFDTAVLVITNPNEKEGHAIAGIKNDPAFDPPFEEPSPQPGASFKEVDGYYACETFRTSLKLQIGNVESKYLGQGWKWRAVPAT